MTEASHDAPTGAPTPELERRSIRTSQGEISYREAGSGPAVVFVHGLLVDGRLWDGVARPLAASHRVIVPDWPLGSHRRAMNADADLAPPGVASLVAEFLEAMDLSDVTIVGNDSGGAISQMLVTSRPERIGRLVLTNCDCFDKFPPFPFNGMPPMARIPGGMRALAQAFRINAVRRITYRVLAAEPIADELTRSWLQPSAEDAGVMRDVTKLVAGVRKEQLRSAADHLPGLEMPVLLVWGQDDRFFKPSDAERMAEVIPDARIEWVEGAKTFVSLDRPQRVAGAIGEFVGAAKPAAAQA